MKKNQQLLLINLDSKIKNKNKTYIYTNGISKYATVYINKFPDLVKEHNNTNHKSIKTKPINV